MKDQVKGSIRERQGQRHIRPHQLNGVTFPARNRFVGGQLRRRIIQQGTIRARSGKNGHLLAAAAGQAQHTGAS